ncbi:MAG: hypothetical protein NTV06_04115 [candidate division Zixibacteria bacterium]|nr:hypothetical protein [candidate division Zixibacteria bacterium]
MKKIFLTVILLLSAISVGYCEEHVSSVLTPQAKGEARAQQDIKNGKMRILYYGIPWSAGKPLLDDESGLPVEIVANCTVTPEFVAETDAYNNLMRKAAKVKQLATRSLQLIIKSDKQVYMKDEQIIIEYEFKNISEKPIKLKDYYKTGPVSFYFKDEQGKTYSINYIDVFGRTMPTELAGGAVVKREIYNLDLTKAENYKIIGKHSIYMKDGNLTSNTITIEVKEKKDLTEDEAIKIAQKALESLNKDAERYYFKDIGEFKRNERDIWLVTFDLKENLSRARDNKAMILGVQIFIAVDKKSGKTTTGGGD